MLQDAQFEAESLEQEIAIMKKVNHPNCIKLHEASARNEFMRDPGERRREGTEGMSRGLRGCASVWIR